MVLAHDITKGDRTRDVQITQNVTFETMLLAPKTLQGLKDAGFYKPSPIQLYGIPIGKCGFDLLLEAKSGTGKTAVFSIIALENMDFQKGLQVVILTPTREIAAQIYDVLKQIGSKYEELVIEVVMGGLPFQEDVEKFKKTVHIVVGSPGRLKHLILNKHIDTNAVRLLVLDEADKLMETSFQADIKFINLSLPKQKQVIMSSATYSKSSKSVINNFVHNANHVCPDSDSILLGIEQKVTFVKYNNNIVRHTQDRFRELLKILVQIQFKQCLVFCNYQARVSEVHKLLKKEKWPSEHLYGQQEQVDRLDALKTLQQYKCRILVSTDLAARGIDASNIDLVVNFEPPQEWQTYLHRIGRAGRFGSYGLAVTILSEGTEQQSFKDMFTTMEISINMRHLWTDKEFIQDHSITPDPCMSLTENPTCSDLPQEVTHEAVWELLNSKNNETTNIESFENLCISQKKCETTKIEQFSDLILSLNENNNEENNEVSSFKHLEIRKISPVKLPTENISTHLQKTVLDNDKYIKNDVNKNVKDTTKIMNSEVSKGLIKVISDETANINDAINNTVTTKNKNETKYVANKMRDLELPIMFSSSKLKRNDAQWNKKVYTSASLVSDSTHKKENFQQKSQLENKANVSKVKHDLDDFDNLDNIPKTYTKSIINTRNRNKTDYDVITYNDAGDYRSNNTMQKTHSSSEHSNNEYVQKLVSSHLKNKSENHYSQHTRAKCYMNWYNQLKIRVNMVQQEIYIDEMSRL